MACSIEREARGRPAEVSCMDVVEGKAPKAQEIGQGAGAGVYRVKGFLGSRCSCMGMVEGKAPKGAGEEAGCGRGGTAGSRVCRGEVPC